MSYQSVLNLIGALVGMAECLAGRFFSWQPFKDTSYLGLDPAFSPENLTTWCHLDIPSWKILKTSQIFRHVTKAANFLHTESQLTTSNKELEKDLCKNVFQALDRLTYPVDVLLPDCWLLRGCRETLVCPAWTTNTGSDRSKREEISWIHPGRLCRDMSWTFCGCLYHKPCSSLLSSLLSFFTGTI